MKFDVVYVDPPWKFANRRMTRRDGGAARFGIGAAGRYDVMSTEALMALPLAEVMADPSVLFCWGSYAMAEDALACINAWGFRVSTIGFQWVKLNRRIARLPFWGKRGLVNAMVTRGLIGFLDWLTFFGVGHWSASNTEPCWIGLRGAPALQRVDKTISSMVYAPRGRHSAKPPEVARRIVKMFGPDRRYLELFARIESPGSAVPGWTATGREFDGLDVLDALRGLAVLEDSHAYDYRRIMEASGRSLKMVDPEPGAVQALLC